MFLLCEVRTSPSRCGTAEPTDVEYVSSVARAGESKGGWTRESGPQGWLLGRGGLRAIEPWGAARDVTARQGRLVISFPGPTLSEESAAGYCRSRN